MQNELEKNKSGFFFLFFFTEKAKKSFLSKPVLEQMLRVGVSWPFWDRHQRGEGRADSNHGAPGPQSGMPTTGGERTAMSYACIIHQ